MANERESDREPWRAALRASLAALPADYRAAHERLTAVRHAFLAEVAAAMEPRLNGHVAGLSQGTYDEKRAVVHAVNEDLRGLNLCVRCKATNGPALLVADFRDDEDRTSRFRFQVADAAGRPARKDACGRLPDLSLMETPAREEGLARRGGRGG